MAMATTVLDGAVDVSAERMAFENALRVWGLEVRFATRELLALGRPYQVQYAIESGTASDVLAALGLELVSIMGSNLLQVRKLTPCSDRLRARVISLHGGSNALDEAVTTLAMDDYLVGINDDDLLVEPMRLADVRKRIARSFETKRLTLRFVHLDRFVRVDVGRQLSHGRVLNVLDDLQKTHARLTHRYNSLLTRNRAVVSKKLQRHKKLLVHVVHTARELRDTVMADERYQLAARFQQWYAAKMSDDYDDGDGCTDTEDVDMSDDASSPEGQQPEPVQQVPAKQISSDSSPRTSSASANMNGISGTSTAPTSPKTREERLRDLGALNVDLKWRDILIPQDMKWLSNAQAILTSFIEGLVDGFLLDGTWRPEMGQASRAITEHLVRKYATTLRSVKVDNTAVKKDFLQHARMIRSNICNQGNQQLRQDLINGSISVERLCEMNSVELAPQALQADRQRWNQEHARLVTITAPTGPVLVKTKAGFKEVNFGGGLGLHEESQGEFGPPNHIPANQEQEIDEEQNQDAQIFVAPCPTMLEATCDGATEEMADQTTEVNIEQDKRKRKRVTFSETVSYEPAPPRSLGADQERRSLKEQEKRKRQVEEGRAFGRVLLDPCEDLIGMLQQAQSTIATTPLSTMNKELILAPGVTLYRDLGVKQISREVLLAARVRVAHLSHERFARNDREATQDALYRLVDAVKEFGRLFDGLINDLRGKFGLSSDNENRRGRDQAFSYLIERQIARSADYRVYKRENGRIEEEIELVITIYGLPLSRCVKVETKIKSIEWTPSVPERILTFTNRLKIQQRIVSLQSGHYRCELFAPGNDIHVKSEMEHFHEAAEDATMKLLGTVKSIQNDWKILVGVYSEILQRKSKEKAKVADPTLSAANETRMSKAVNKWVQVDERSRSHLVEFSIRVHGLTAICQACRDVKVAKRSASEEFRDLLQSLSQLSTSASRTSVGSGASRPAQTAQPTRGSRTLSSDSSDHDMDGYDDFYSSDEIDDWDPSMKPEGSVMKDKLPARSRLDIVKDEQYRVESESESTDDARMRAVIRSLFTPGDELCDRISALRGALKYRGSYDTGNIVPNVRACIRLERLREDTFDVRASVNDILFFKATARSKQEACDTAVDGLLQHLNEIRSVWVQLLHFFHVKELGTSDLMDSFNALRLAGITSISANIEPSRSNSSSGGAGTMTSGVTGVLRVGDHVLCRADELNEDDARAVVTCRVAKFLVNLIDNDLDPEPIEDSSLDTNLVASKPEYDWSGLIRIQELGSLDAQTEYHVDGMWCTRNRIPPDTAFSPRDLAISQVNRISMVALEKALSDLHESALPFFKLESAYENGKFVNLVAEYGHKNRTQAYILRCEITPPSKFELFILPPGASINSDHNLYWPEKLMPPELSDRKAVYGFLMPQELVARYFGEARSS
ncbi:hypothetical protein Poli38472_003310 [Pythium oligandrum]|uniref:TFIIS central domain-containing protein n=1 Tax=Pythium oligandrum TaxID=41045 RepID=A0A8K1C6K6_PYTOL|nr:hypothetical protein Poli38472_003310 [Pythium oligandrum]|eukprot:TMW57385.1 hypothetical protein Poli38472_003310 [Pythium oligandrum]